MKLTHLEDGYYEGNYPDKNFLSDLEDIARRFGYIVVENNGDYNLNNKEFTCINMIVTPVVHRDPILPGITDRAKYMVTYNLIKLNDKKRQPYQDNTMARFTNKCARAMSRDIPKLSQQIQINIDSINSELRNKAQNFFSEEANQLNLDALLNTEQVDTLTDVQIEKYINNYIQRKHNPTLVQYKSETRIHDNNAIEKMLLSRIQPGPYNRYSETRLENKIHEILTDEITETRESRARAVDFEKGQAVENSTTYRDGGTKRTLRKRRTKKHAKTHRKKHKKSHKKCNKCKRGCTCKKTCKCKGKCSCKCKTRRHKKHSRRMR